MSYNNNYDYENKDYTDVQDVKEGLDHFVKDSIRFLRDRANEPLPDDHPLSTDKELFGEYIDTLLQGAFTELKLDPDDAENSRNYMIIKDEIFNEGIKFDQFKEHGLTENNLKLKLVVFSRLTNWVNENLHLGSIWEKLKDRFKKLVDVINDILGSLAKIITAAASPLEILKEFKDIFKNTRKAIS
jgi:hypothetical protein